MNLDLDELKIENWKAYTALIDFWAELSRTSLIVAKNDIKMDLGSRYDLLKSGDGIFFVDNLSGDKFFYDEGKSEWNFL
jgi:hypothetical protein